MRIFALALCLAASPWGGGLVYAHSWYPYDCCSDRDCWPMGLDQDAREPDPKIVPGGYLTHDGHFVPEGATRASRDGRFHICRSGGTLTGTVIAPVAAAVLPVRAQADVLEHFPIQLDRSNSLESWFNAFSPREPVPFSLENALADGAARPDSKSRPEMRGVNIVTRQAWS